MKQGRDSAMQDFYIVRARGAGVFFGHIKERSGSEVTMTNARRLWRWRGASDCCQLAAEGVKRPDDCQFTLFAEEIILIDVVEIQRCTEAAAEILREVQIWKS